MKLLFYVLILIVLLMASGCGGFRSGFVSVPYVGEPDSVAAALTAADSNWLIPDVSIELPGVKLKASVNNMLRTRDIAVMLFVIPIHIDLMDNPSYRETDRFTISLTIIPAEAGFVFDPAVAVATIDGQGFSPISCKQIDWQRWKMEHPELSRDEVVGSVPLKKGEYQSFEMTFASPVPTTDRVITLELGRALLHKGFPPPPLIRFRQVRWTQGYT